MNDVEFDAFVEDIKRLLNSADCYMIGALMNNEGTRQAMLMMIPEGKCAPTPDNNSSMIRMLYAVVTINQILAKQILEAGGDRPHAIIEEEPPPTATPQSTH